MSSFMFNLPIPLTSINHPILPASKLPYDYMFDHFVLSIDRNSLRNASCEYYGVFFYCGRLSGLLDIVQNGGFLWFLRTVKQCKVLFLECLKKLMRFFDIKLKLVAVFNQFGGISVRVFCNIIAWLMSIILIRDRSATLSEINEILHRNQPWMPSV